MATSEELGTLIDKLRDLPIENWEAKRPFESAEVPDYRNTMEEYKVEVKGGNGRPSDFSIIISTSNDLEIRSYQCNGKCSEFYRELSQRIEKHRYEKEENERKSKEPEILKERSKFLKFLGVR